MAKIAAAHKEGATVDLDKFRDSAGVFRGECSNANRSELRGARK